MQMSSEKLRNRMAGTQYLSPQQRAEYDLLQAVCRNKRLYLNIILEQKSRLTIMELGFLRMRTNEGAAGVRCGRHNNDHEQLYCSPDAHKQLDAVEEGDFCTSND